MLATHRDRIRLVSTKAANSEIPVLERDIRLEDYLNDKLQTALDFENLDSLIQNVEIQKTQLQEQLRDATSRLAASKEASEQHTQSVLARTASFKEHQNSIQKRLSVVTNSDTATEAVQRFRGPMEKLRRVELAQAYVELLSEIDKLSEEARDHLPNDPKSALRPYTRIKELGLALHESQDSVEGAGVHLVAYVDKRIAELWNEMRRILSDEFEIVLNTNGWPEEPTVTEAWTACFNKLLELQSTEIALAKVPLILLPIGVMARPYVQGFRYHFLSDKSTASHRELCANAFRYILNKIKSQERFLRNNIDYLLFEYFYKSDLAGNSLYFDAVSAFITALLPIVKEKIDGVMKQVSKEPVLMSQLISQIIEFDDTLRKSFDYTGGNIDHGWKGLAYDVLEDWFDTWWKYEKDFTLSRYQSIMKDEESGQIDYESTPDKTKPTNGAVKVVDLLRIVTEKYRDLRRFSHRTRFLIYVQIAILDAYYERLNDSLSVYQSFTSTVGRKLHGITKEQEAELSGLGGLQSLCKVFGSADYVVAALEELNNEEFFITLWNELQARARQTEVNDSVAGPMTLGDVKDVISSSLGSDEDGGGMFDESVATFKSLRSKAEQLIIQAIKYAYPTSLRPYFHKPQWTTITSEPVSMETLNITAELDQTLQVQEENLKFLRKALGQSVLRRIWRECLEELQDLLWNEVLLKQTFTTLGAAQFQRDLKGIKDGIRNNLRPIRGTDFELPKLTEGLELLNLPVDMPEGHSGMTIKDAASKCLGNSADAQEVLQQLGFNVLSVLDARNVLARRVEVMD
ncbi:hypothetical protein BP5796_10464 [Coleophoma crateriformis]|uniref:RAD50-interacting protein 1 n=1 Tax=Coleophoma crateriformis TaxID=565419 RepID=A0A3D8QQ92_9HELO|nr:hypothetical protein BP5796_10464 [Coleophoma crateriformis]